MAELTKLTPPTIDEAVEGHLADLEAALLSIKKKICCGFREHRIPTLEKISSIFATATTVADSIPQPPPEG